MPEIRASRIGGEYDPDGSDPVLVIRDEHGVLRAFTKITRLRDPKRYEDVLVLELEDA